MSILDRFLYYQVYCIILDRFTFVNHGLRYRIYTYSSYLALSRESFTEITSLFSGIAEITSLFSGIETPCSKRNLLGMFSSKPDLLNMFGLVCIILVLSRKCLKCQFFYTKILMGAIQRENKLWWACTLQISRPLLRFPAKVQVGFFGLVGDKAIKIQFLVPMAIPTSLRPSSIYYLLIMFLIRIHL